MVLADRPAPPNPNLRLYSHSLGHSPVVWYASQRWADAATADFPRSLAAVPVLLPPPMPRCARAWTPGCTTRACVRVAGEFEDSALLATFGAEGMGAFPAAVVADARLRERYGLTRVGDCTGVEEQFYAIGTDKKVVHPLVRRLLPGG